MDTKIRIVSNFHRFVGQGDGKPERREAFVAGAVVDVSQEDADDWIARGLAEAVETENRRPGGFDQPLS